MLGVRIDGETGKVVPLGGSFEGEGGVSTSITLGASVFPKPETRNPDPKPEKTVWDGPKP